MIKIEPLLFLSIFIIFCRVGGCLMFIPGFSSQRIPMQIRLFVAFAVTLALTPILLDSVRPLLQGGDPVTMARLIASETLKGSLIGLLGRMFFAALETLGTFTSMAIGMSANLGVPINEDEAGSPIVSLMTMAATVLLFITNQHWEIFRGLAASYDALPVADPFETRVSLVQLTDSASKSFFLALRISSPFIIYSIILNTAVGLTSKLVPNIPLQFVTMPAILAGGLLLMYFTANEFMDLFVSAFSGWLVAGR